MGKLTLIFLWLITAVLVVESHGKKIGLTHLIESLSEQEPEIYNDPMIVGYPMRLVKAPLLMLSFKLGSQETPQYAIMDTGSTHRWVVCENHYEADYDDDTDLFNPALSSSYRALNCDDATCPANKCKNPSRMCLLNKKYGSTVVDLALGYETFTFNTYDGTVTHPQLLFGCADPLYRWDVGQGEPRCNGVFGLADTVLLANLGNGNPRFSYCVGNLSDKSDTSSHLMLGEHVNLYGTSTPMVNRKDKLEVDIEGICIGKDICINYPMSMFIDTGTHPFRIASPWYPYFRKTIQNIMLRLGFETFNDDVWDRTDCYAGVVEQIKGFPGITINFKDGKKMVLGARHIFYRISRKYFCTAIAQSHLSNMESILGVRAQQGFNMGFDLNYKRFYFFAIDNCRLLA